MPNLLAWVGILGGLSAIFSPFLGLAALPLALWAIHLRAHPWTSDDQTAPRASDEAERVFLAFVLLLVAFYAMGNKGVGSDRLTIPEQHKKDVTCMLLSVLGLCAFLVRDILRRKSIITGCFTIACAFLLLELFVMWVWN